MSRLFTYLFLSSRLVRMDDNEIIDRLGGTAAVARICDVTPQAVSYWRKHGIPKSRMMYLVLRFPDEIGLPAKVA